MDLTKRKFLFLGIAFFWLLIATLNLSQTYLSSYVRGWNFVWVEQLVYASGWLLWIVYTPIIFYFVRKNPIQEQITWRFLKKNILIAMAFALLQCTFDIALQYSLWNLIIEPKQIFEFYGSFYYKYHVNLFIFLFVAGASFTVDYLKRSRQLEVEKGRLENLLTESKLTSIKNQIQPHFLFNAHHNIVGLMMKGENEEAIRMLTKLSDLLRETLELGDKQFIPLKEELEILGLFLDIHQIRFSDRLSVEIDVPQNVMDIQFPVMILQPLVENALKHGISKSSSAGKLKIKVLRDGDRINASIEDDGPGCAGPIQEGIGLKTTKNRLTHLYGDQFHLKTKNLEPNGFSINLSFPISDGK